MNSKIKCSFMMKRLFRRVGRIYEFRWWINEQKLNPWYYNWE